MAGEHAKVSHLPSVRRLPAYLHLLEQYQQAKQEYISGTIIATALHIEPIQVRKDLAITGVVGKPRVGFPVAALITAIEQFLGWDHDRAAVLIGAGHLGSALLGYQGFLQHGLRIVAVFDTAPAKIGTVIHGLEVLALDTLPEVAPRVQAPLAIVTVPAGAAQAVADLVVASGFTGIWNFTPTTLTVPASVVVQNEDLSCGLAVLTKRLQAQESRPSPLRHA